MKAVDLLGRLVEVEGTRRTLDADEASALRTSIMIKLSRAGLAYRSIGKVMGCSSSAVGHRLKQAGVLDPREKRGRKKADRR